MAKDEPVAPPPLTEQQLKIAVNDVGRSPTTMKRFIAQQLMTFAAENNGEIDITNKQFTDGIATLMTAVQTKSQKDRGIGVLSIAQTEADMTKDIQNAIARGADPQLFEPAKASLLSVKSELADKVKSNKGVASLIGEFIKDQSLANGIPFMNAETGRGLVPQEKAELVAKLMPYVKFPDNVAPFVTKDITFVPNIIAPHVQARMAEFFSKEGKLSEFGSCTLDPSKMTPENMTKFGAKVSTDLEAISIIEQSVKKLEKKGYKVSRETRQEIAKQLMPALNSLGSEYLATNNGNLVKELAASLDKRKNFLSLFSENFDIAENDLHSVATKITTDHFTKSEKAAVKKYQSGFSNINVKLASNTALSEKLNKFLEARGENPISLEQFKKLSDKDLAQYRKVDPKEFDKVVFGVGAAPVVAKAKPVAKEVPVEVIVPPKPKESVGPPPRPISPPPSLITPPLVQPLAPKLEKASVVAPPQVDSIAMEKAKAIIDASIKAEGYRITPERVEKITKALLPTLTKLGPEYLEQNKASLIKELVTSLKSEQSYSTSFTGNYTVSTASLGKIATKLENQHQPQAERASVKKVEGTINTKRMSTGEIVTKLNSFVKETGMTKDGKPLEFNAKSIPTNADIGKMRQSNPKQFDSIFNAPKALPKLSPVLAQQASVVGHNHGLPPAPPPRRNPKPPTTPPPPTTPNIGVGAKKLPTPPSPRPTKPLPPPGRPKPPPHTRPRSDGFSR